jgi:ABC-type nitrate/sulfonate/bicarbonate transport system permease component
VRRATYPLLVTSQAIPIVVLAPVLVFWLGFGLLPKLVIVALLCFFPVVVATLDALGRVDPEQRKLLRTMDATRWQVFRWAEAPAALPAALSGAKVAVVLAVIAAVLAEGAGAEEGLGVLITQSNAQLEIARSYAAVALLMVLSVALFTLLQTLERRAAPWAHRPSAP